MYKNLNFIKKISLTLVFGVIFFGMGVVFAKDYPDYTTSNDCGQIPSYSSDSNNGSSYATNTASPLLRYTNNMTAINRAAANTSNTTVCESFPLEGGQTRLDRKKTICEKPIMDPLYQYQIGLFSYYNQNILTGKYGRGFTSNEKVWNLQSMMKEANCHNHRDCKLGVITISDFLFCNVCEAIDSDWKETTTINTVDCPDGYTPVDGVSCCEPGCTTTIETSVDLNMGYTEGEDFSVIVKFESESDIKNITLGSFVVDGGEIKNINCDKPQKKCTFDLSPIGDGEINIKAPLGTATLIGDAKCEEAITKIDIELEDDEDEEIECTPPELEILSGKSNCIESYGSGWIKESNGCCFLPCDKVQQTKPEGKILDKENCKRVCDSKTACCGIKLNTVVPFIGDCIEMTTQNTTHTSNGDNTSNVNQLNAFPFLMMGLSKILVTVILIFSFLIVIAAGLMMVTGVYEEGNYKKGMDRIKKVVVALILLGSSGLILKLINPSFFGG